MKEIKTIPSNMQFGVRVLCNLSPEELKERKKEVIENFLENLKFDIEFVLEGEGKTPTQSQDVLGFWSYFVTLN